MSSMLLDIQGLRCLAVTFVLLFHLWPTLFKSGFLGVDIFFVISGFLMCKILNNKDISLSTTKDFYFRRIRRIVPLYLTLITLTLLTSFLLMPAFEFNHVASEAQSAMFFVSNYFNLPKTGYFDVTNQYPLFLHTWSLSVEIQFYSVVPLLFLVFNKLKAKGKVVGGMFFLAIGVTSLALQMAFSENTNISHMAFFCRIWQFICGFAACLYRSRSHSNNTTVYTSLPLENNSQHDKVPLAESNTKTSHRSSMTSVIASNFVVLLLCLQLSVSMIEDREFERIAATFTATLFLCCEGPSILSGDWAVYIGDISYAVYLIHWPVFTLFKYMGYGRDNNVIYLTDGFFLLFFTVLLAHFFENIIKYITIHLLKKWTTLLLLTTLLYTMAGGIIFAMQLKSEEVVVVGSVNGTDIEKFVENLFDKREKMPKLSVKETTDLNANMVDYLWENFKVCHNKTMALDTDFKVNKKNYDYMCHDEGTGTKEIVLFGNSLARDLFYSVKTSMKDVYSRLSMFGLRGCMPFLPNLVNPKGCPAFTSSILPILRQWKRPIDIVITQHSWWHLRFPDFSPNDTYQQELQSFYSQLSEIVQDTIIMNRGDLFEERSFQDIQKAITKGDDIKKFDLSFTKHQEQNRLVYKRIDALDCPKCLRASIYEQSFCSDLTNRCAMVNPNGIMNFHDGRHVTMFGSLVMGRTLRMEYDKWTAQTRNVTHD